jgi:hypothetical protein
LNLIDKGRRCPNYSYTIKQIYISIKCFLGSSTAFRGLSNVFQILQEWIVWIGTPAYTTIRQWLLKVGLYKLERPKYSPNGWFFIIDTSIQMGPQKVVVVLGVKILEIGQNFCPTFEGVEPLAVVPLCNCPGEVINEILEKATIATGEPPLAIISDEGSELKKGVRLFTQKHPETIHLFDISHKINSCLKKEFENDAIWLAFKTASTASIQNLKLSSTAYLAPPRQRTKGRMHSAFPLIEWAENILHFLDSTKISTLTLEEKNKITWIRNYQFALPFYTHFKEMCEEALEIVHQQGYYTNIADAFLKRTVHLSLQDHRTTNFREKIRVLLEEEGRKVPKEAHYLGSSEVIESLFGKFKALEDNHASSGLTSLVLAIPALVGKMDEFTIEQALQEVCVDDLENWNKSNLGQTFLSRRRDALKRHREYDLDLELCDFFT